MSTLKTDVITNQAGSGPPTFPFGFNIGSGGSGSVNNIGLPGGQGFGLGICPGPLPVGMAKLSGCEDPASDNYGNYLFADGSVMCWIPAFYYKIGTGSNGLAINVVSVKAFGTYADVATANAAGYALHRAFYDGGAVQYGVFVDKYLCSNNGGTASSLKNGIVLSTAQRGTIANTAYATLTGAPANAFYGSIAAAKTRGASFFCNSRFIHAALALLSMAHGQAASSTTFCGWYSAGSTNFPKGNNNNALGDANDGSLLYTADGNVTYPGCGKTGSANLFNRTTHNGQNSGVADLNGLVSEINLGAMTVAAQVYVAKTAAAMKSFTGGTTLDTDHWGATGAAARFDAITIISGTSNNYFGNGANQVLSEATSGDAWKLAGLAFAKDANAISAGGTALFGNDYYYNATVAADMCLASGGNFGHSGVAGVFCVHLHYGRTLSSPDCGFRSACYL